MESKKFIYSRNKRYSQVVRIGTFRIIMSLGHVLELNQVYIPDFSRNLIYVSRLVIYDYKFLFENKLNIYRHDVFVGNGTLVDNLYRLDINLDFAQNYLYLHVTVVIKRTPMNENSSLFWH